jgi:hypothetical protein
MNTKIKFIAVIIIAAISVSVVNAKIWRVNNRIGINADFSSITTALTTASENDTIYLEGSPVSYGTITLAKPVTIIGTGYFLTENPQTQAFLNNSKVGDVTFNLGSEGSLIMGLETGSITLLAGNIIIKKCYLNSASININNNSSSFGNILITQSYIGSSIASNNGPFNINNIIISNNYIYYGLSFYGTYTALIGNNVFDNSGIHVFNSAISNNIVRSGSVDINNNSFSNNIGNLAQFPTGNGNQQNVDLTSVFTGSVTTEGKWQLNDGSPAKNAGNDGNDCGMFGGATPYVLSGMPDIPAIYNIIMPTTGFSNDGINVTIKAMVH